MVPQFEPFDRHRGGVRKRPGQTVTVQPRGLMSFSAEAYALLGCPAAVQFAVDFRKRLVGFQACDKGGENAYPVYGPGRTVSARALLRSVLGALPDRSRRYPLHVADGLPPYIDLGEDAPAVSGGRRGKTAVTSSPRTSGSPDRHP